MRRERVVRNPRDGAAGKARLPGVQPAPSPPHSLPQSLSPALACRPCPATVQEASTQMELAKALWQ